MVSLMTAKVAALDAAGHFRCTSNINNNGGQSKKGTVNVAAGAGKEDGGDESRDEATYHTVFFESSSRTPKKMDLQWMEIATQDLYCSSRRAGTKTFKCG